jgi:predicted transcriptional regulator
MSTEVLDKPALVDLTASIAAAYVGNNTVALEAVPRLVTSIYGALAMTQQSAEPVDEPREPACSRRASVSRDYVRCMECGTKMKMLKRHLMTEHNLTVSEYRQRWNLPDTHPMVAPTYADKRRDLAKAIGLGRSAHQHRHRK